MHCLNFNLFHQEQNWKLNCQGNQKKKNKPGQKMASFIAHPDHDIDIKILLEPPYNCGSSWLKLGELTWESIQACHVSIRWPGQFVGLTATWCAYYSRHCTNHCGKYPYVFTEPSPGDTVNVVSQVPDWSRTQQWLSRCFHLRCPTVTCLKQALLLLESHNYEYSMARMNQYTDFCTATAIVNINSWYKTRLL